MGYITLKRISVLGTKVSVTNLQGASLYLKDCIEQQKRTYVCIAPVSTVVDAWRNDAYRRIINSSGMTTPDGIPLVWLGKLKGERTIGRTYGPDLMLKFCELSQQKGYKHYFYGGTKETNRLLAARLQERFPGLNIVGNFAPPFRAVGEKEEEAVLEQINESNPDILWVGLGSPKQDYWMYHHRDQLNVPVIIGVGAAFDFISGVKKQAPPWMRGCGLEWFFRLCCEPGRLWRRYLFGNALFVFLILKDFFRKKV